MVIKIWHGSEKIIKKPMYNEGKIHNDYGKGFYCTESKELAKEWACKEIGKDGFANCYEFDTDGLKILDLSDDKYNVLNWLAILAFNRNFKTSLSVAREAKKYLINNFGINTDDYDIIKGYRADDSYFAFARAFVNNQISVDELERAMKLGKLGEQIVLKSPKAFERIKYVEYEIAENQKYYHRRLERNKKAEDDLTELLINADIKGLHIIDIMRKEEENSD